MTGNDPFEPVLEEDNLPVPAADTDIVTIADLPAEQQQKARALMTQLDTGDSQSIIAFGVDAQSELTKAADQMIQTVRNKDVGPVGDSLSNLMLEVRGLGIDELSPEDRGNWFQRAILRRVHPVAQFIQRYESVQSQIDDLVVVLGSHRKSLLRDVTMLDGLYAATLEYFHRLEVYIAAGAAKLQELDRQVIPQLQARATETGDMLDAQTLRDTVARRDDLDRRVHDLRLTRQVTIQSLPQIRLIQDVDKSLVNKIQSSILTTVPVWKSQIAMAITLWNQRKALETQKRVTDTTNEMLAKNAELLKTGSAQARREIERGIFDIETVKKVNADLISTIQESIEIAQEGRRKRIEAEAEMKVLETDLKQALIKADAAQDPLSRTS